MPIPETWSQLGIGIDPPYYNYQGANLRKLLGSGGKRKLFVRFYYTGVRNFKKKSLQISQEIIC